MKRSECIGTARPCCKFSCKHNLSLDVYGSVGELERRVNENLFRESDFQYNTNCVLDIVDMFPDGLSNFDIAKILNTNKETIRLESLEGLTQSRMFFKDFEVDNASIEDWINKLEEFIEEHYSPHYDDVQTILEDNPRLTYNVLYQVVTELDWQKRLGLSDFDWEVVCNPLEFDNEIVERYSLTTLPFVYEANDLGERLGFSVDMIEVWIAKGLEFLVGRNGEVLIERANLIEFLETHGKYHYKVINHSDSSKRISQQDIQEFKLNIIRELQS